MSRFEHMKYLQCISLDADSARLFFGMPNAYVVDTGPVPEDRSYRYSPKARVFHVYPDGKPAGAPLRLVTRNGERIS